MTLHPARTVREYGDAVTDERVATICDVLAAILADLCEPLSALQPRFAVLPVTGGPSTWDELGTSPRTACLCS